MGSPRYNKMKDYIYKLDGGLCHICGRAVSYSQAVLDHIVPHLAWQMCGVVASEEYWNLRLAHLGCNTRRSNARIAGQLRLALYTDNIEPLCGFIGQ